MSCKDARPAYRNKIQMTHKAKVLHAKAQCRSCKKTMFKSYKMDSYQELKRKFHVVDVLELNDGAHTASMTQIQEPTENEPNDSYLGGLFQ